MPSVATPNALFINTIVLGGPVLEKIRAAHDAGFDRIELWQHDLDEALGGTDGLRRDLEAHELGLADLQVVRDFEGAPDERRESKRAEVKGFLEQAVSVGAPMILVAASTDPGLVPERIVEDLQWLADEAGKSGLRVAYESLAWSFHVTTLPLAWATVHAVDRENLGIVIDPFHVFVHGRTVADLDGIPVDRIFLVQLSDLPGTVTPAEVIETARHHRLLPGEGVFDIDSVLVRLLEAGYSGPIGLEVFNDVMKASAPGPVALRALGALRSALGRAAESIAVSRSAEFPAA